MQILQQIVYEFFMKFVFILQNITFFSNFFLDTVLLSLFSLFCYVSGSLAVALRNAYQSENNDRSTVFSKNRKKQYFHAT